jgi:hypothetical protein
MKARKLYLPFLLMIMDLVFGPRMVLLAQTNQQSTGSIQGQVADPSGAMVPQANVAVTSASGRSATATSNAEGVFLVRGLGPGKYTVSVTAPGFAQFHAETVVAGGPVKLNIVLPIQVEEQHVQVTANDQNVSTSPENNANALVIKGRDLDALSDDPDEMLNELQALAGPAAGPNGGEIYIDGFSGGQLPPKASIREIRINQNPFSAQHDRLGYGRIEIFTRPGTDRPHGQIGSRGNDASFNSRNPVLVGPPPGYHSWDLNGAISGPMSKSASYFLSALWHNHQNTSVVDAIAPSSITASNPDGTLFNGSFENPNSRMDISPRIDVQLGEANTLTLRYGFFRADSTNQGIGETSLPAQAYNTHNTEHEFQWSDSLVLNSKVVDDIRFQYRRIHNRQAGQSTSPTVTVQGAFTSGGSNLGTVDDGQNDFELQNYFAASAGNHSLNFGARLRAYFDTNRTDSGSNGDYTFQSTADYLNRSPQKYTVTVISNNAAGAALFDAAVFYQDDWKIGPRSTLSYGLRWETQNRIHDRSDWAPRASFAWAPGHGSTNQPAKTVLRAGYGWFYQRFTVPNSFASMAGTPYTITAIHQNGINQVGYTVTNPTGYQETSPGTAVKPPTPSSSQSAQTQYSIASNFHAAMDMQAAIGVDRQIAKHITGNLTWLYSRGVHQYLTNNLGAPFFPTSAAGIYPAAPLPPASENLMQFQSGGIYQQNQMIATTSARYRRYSFVAFYTYNNARGDTSGVTWVPSIAQAPKSDYGRTSFDIHHRVVIAGNIFAPYGLSFSPMVVYNSGTPYNITIGSDLTGNNQFNARPTFADLSDCASSPARYVTTRYGCLDTSPIGTDEKIIPYGLGTGPSNFALNLHISKVIGIGPRVEGTENGTANAPPPPGGGPGGLGTGGLSGSHADPRPMDETASRRYSLTFAVVGHNLFNNQNLATPNGVLTSPPSLRFKSQPSRRRQPQHLSRSSFQLLTAAHVAMLFAFLTCPVRLAVAVVSHFLRHHSYSVELLILCRAAGLAIAVLLHG